MLIKCKTKGTRVKGIAFHPSLNLLLAALHNGDIELWDYVSQTLVEVFKQHDGPARGLDFHQIQPLFASGGDDTTLVVWDFKQKKKLFVLTGHSDYIRFVQFHKRYPWIISSSDDNTVRIWNWQSRRCVHQLVGHNHYVMCAQFNMNRDLIVSASLDHTARVWDFSILRKKNCSMGTSSGLLNDVAGGRLFTSDVQLYADDHDTTVSDPKFGEHVPGDLITPPDVYCMHVLNGHTRGINWAIFHEKSPIIITAADDKTIRCWRYTSTNAWQTNILRGHNNNVCSLIMHPNGISYLLSVSEDKSIRIWNTNKWVLCHTFVMGNDRVWIISKSCNSNYIAAGHDSGLLVFKLFKERPIVTLVNNVLYYVWNNIIYMNNVEKECADYNTPLTDVADSSTGRTDSEVIHGADSYDLLENGSNFNYSMGNNVFDDEQYECNKHSLLFPCPSGDYTNKRTVLGTLIGVPNLDAPPTKFVGHLRNSGPTNGEMYSTGSIVPISIACNVYNSECLTLLICYKSKSNSYFEISNIMAAGNKKSTLNGQVRQGISACFATRNALVSIDSNKRALIYNIFGEFICNLDLPCLVDHVYPICLNVVLFRSESTRKLLLYNVMERRIVAQTHSPFSRLLFVLLCKSKRLIATVYRNNIVIYNRDLTLVTSIEQHSKIKSAAWCDNTGVVYSTSNHLHYLLVNGDNGILSSIEKPLYILRIDRREMYVMERNHRCFKMPVVSDEFAFKCALYYNISSATKLIDAGKLYGKAIVTYLIEKCHAQLARRIIKDPKQRFDLSIKFGALNDCLEDAQQLDSVEIWKNLGEVALQQGNCAIAELCFQKSKQFSKLTLLYIITGNTAKLKKMLNISKFRKDIKSIILHSLYLGDIEQLQNALIESGQHKLAELCKATYSDSDSNSFTESKYIIPSQPLRRFEGDDSNWPILSMENNAENVYYDDEDVEELNVGLSHENLIGSFCETEVTNVSQSNINTDIWGGITEDELALSTFSSMEPSAVSLQDTADGPPIYATKSMSLQQQIANRNRIPLYYVIIGEFDKALKILEQSYGLNNATLLQCVIRRIYQSSRGYASIMPNAIPMQVPLYGNQANLDLKSVDVLHSFLSLNYVTLIMQRGYTMVTEGNFNEAMLEFKNALCHLIFLLAVHPNESKSFISQCRIYILAMLLESERANMQETDLRRSLELAAYFTCCEMQSQHRYLVLRRTMGIMWKAQNYKTAAMMVTKLLKQNVSNIEGAVEEMQKAQRIYTLCEQKGIETHQLDFSLADYDNFSLCTVSFVKTRAEPIVQCRLCKAIALEKYRNSTCNICQLCKLG